MTTVTLLSDITYAEVDGRALQLDLYLPNMEGPVPTVIYTCTEGAGDVVTKRTMQKRV